MLLAFGQGPLTGGEEPPTARSSSVQTVTRAMDPGWFDAWRRGSLRAIAEQDLGTDIATLDAADHVHVIACTPGIVTDLAYLQEAWAMARTLITRGASVILDAHAMSYIPGARVQPAGEPFDIRREVRVVYETDAMRARDAHAMHTRGMRKFGAPDLIALCNDEDVALIGPAMTELADHVARGTDLASPRHAVEIAAGVRWVAVADEHGLGHVLQLNNEARVLVDDTGHDLIGIVARLPGRVN
jgi:hypothetical protein